MSIGTTMFDYTAQGKSLEIWYTEIDSSGTTNTRHIGSGLLTGYDGSVLYIQVSSSDKRIIPLSTVGFIKLL